LEASLSFEGIPHSHFEAALASKPFMSGSVSILIPCHNAGQYLPDTIQSALNQTWPEKEIIIVNDASTDESGAIFQQINRREVRVITQRAGSAARARNLAFKSSAGQYVKFLDADDLLSADCITRQIRALNGRTDVVAMSEWARFHTAPGEAVFSPDVTWETTDSVTWLSRAWNMGGAMMQCGMFLIPRPLLLRSGLWDERLSLLDDFEFFARLLLKATTVQFTPGARLYYRSGNTESLSARKDRTAVESAFRSLSLGTACLLETEDSERTRRACANVLQNFIYTFYPEHADLTNQLSQKAQELGGSDWEPPGTPGYELLKPLLGRRFARRLENFAANHRLNRAGLRDRFSWLKR
jgi:glycosyltransferase involved in cell wall biosynthesis